MATSVFENFKETGYSKQILSIGVTECDHTDSSISWFFRMIQNFELNILISSNASEQNAKSYFNELETWIKKE